MINESISIDFACVNCEQIFVISKNAKLFCSLRCREDAKLVRYARACILNGIFNDPDIQKVIRTRFAFSFSEKGYYDEKARKLSPEKRSKVFERDNGLCQKCGKAGTEIDHINGSSSDKDNLQLLCYECHSDKTKAGFVEITPEQKGYEEKKAKFISLRNRIKAVSPQRLCDDPVNWNSLQKQMISEQQQLLRKIKEDFESISEKEDTIEKKLAIQEIDELAELELQLENLELQKQAQIDQILTSEIKSKIERVESDFANSVRNIKENIETTKKRIRENVLQHGETVSGTGLQIIWNSGRVSWDLKSLEKHAESHPEILKFRKEGKPFVSFRRISKDK